MADTVSRIGNIGLKTNTFGNSKAYNCTAIAPQLTCAIKVKVEFQKKSKLQKKFFVNVRVYIRCIRYTL